MRRIPLALSALGLVLALGCARGALAGGPLPDSREDDFAHVCKGGSADGQSCSMLTPETDCPRGRCIPVALTKALRGTLTLIAHDAVTDWATGGAGNQALTLLL